MSDEELADWIMSHDCKTNLYGYLSREETLDWLKQEIPALPQKAPLCLSCKHGENGCVDDFATCYCPHHGYVGQKTECGEYDAKEVLDNG